MPGAAVRTRERALSSVPVSHLSALDSLFMDSSRESAQIKALREALQSISRSGVTVWITHQVNATALTGEYLGMGEAPGSAPEEGEGKFPRNWTAESTGSLTWSRGQSSTHWSTAPWRAGCGPVWPILSLKACTLSGWRRCSAAC